MNNDQVAETAIEEEPQALDDRLPYQEHPLFVDAERQLAAGQAEGAAQTLRQLTDLYPEDDTIRELEMRAALRSTFTMADSLPVRRGQPSAILRTVLLSLILIATCLTASAGFAFAYERWVRPSRELHQRELYISGLWQSAGRRLAAGDLSGAREVLDELALALPGSQEVEAAFGVLAGQEVLTQMYVSAVQKEVEGDWAGALALLQELEATSPGYRDVRQRLFQVERSIELDKAWQEAQRLVGSNDWPAIVTLLTDIRRRSPGFHRGEIDTYLFDAYTLLARQLLDQAGGNVGQVEQATDYLEMALELRPTQRDLVEERRLARLYVTGAAAYMEEAWAKAVQAWEPIHRVRPDYQGGVVDTYLYQAYPRAAQDLLESARGEAKPMQQAIGYLDQVLARSVDDPWVIEERTLAVEYLTGLQAYNDARWDEAIVHWGPIYLVRSSYQGGVLRDKLRIACAATEIEYDNWCLP